MLFIRLLVDMFNLSWNEGVISPEQQARIDERLLAAETRNNFFRYCGRAVQQCAVPYGPAEGKVRPCFDGFVDPLRIGRTLHDVVGSAMHDLAKRQSAVLVDILGQSHAAEKPDTVKSGSDVLTVVNMVHGCYSNPLADDERSLDIDEESLVGLPKKYRNGDITHRDDPSIHNHEESLPRVLSLYSLQRRWLMLGYEKSNTSLIIRYSSRWPANHIVFTTGRIQTMGPNNRRTDRALLKHATSRFMYHPVNGHDLKPRRAGLTKRVSHNFITVQRLPPGQSICLGLFAAKMKPDETDKPKTSKDEPKSFKNIIFKDRPRKLRTLLYHNNIINVGTSSLAALGPAVNESSAAYWKKCLNTPENIAAEKALIRNGVISREIAETVLGYTFLPNGDIV